MMIETPQKSADSPAGSAEGKGKTSTGRTALMMDIGSFALAVVIVATAGLFIMMYGWVVKKPVPWPEDVQVSEYRNTSMPTQFGENYSAVTEDDPYYAENENQDGADLIFPEDDIGPTGLDITTPFDDERLAQRSTNWYLVRYYRDNRENPPGGFRYWRLDVYYYTGLRDKIPHVPNICLLAGGADIEAEKPIEFAAPAAPAPWNAGLTFQKVLYTKLQRGGIESRGAEYYLLVVNGAPVDSSSAITARFYVTKELTSLATYNYFAKIQFSPFGPINFDPQQADEAARQFAAACIPAVVTQLPSPTDVEQLERTEQAND